MSVRANGEEVGRSGDVNNGKQTCYSSIVVSWDIGRQAKQAGTLTKHSKAKARMGK
jgi:hypothetical protein